MCCSFHLFRSFAVDILLGMDVVCLQEQVSMTNMHTQHVCECEIVYAMTHKHKRASDHQLIEDVTLVVSERTQCRC